MLREINERKSDSIVVTLYWDDEANTMTVEAEDLKTGYNASHTGIPAADRDEWKKAFDHPYTYGKAGA